MRNFFLAFLIVLFFFTNLKAQYNFSYKNPQEFVIANTTVSGVEFLNLQTIIDLSGLTVGSKLILPSDQVSKAINNLWDQDLFTDVKVSIKSIKGDKIYLDISIKERPRLSEYTFSGIRKGEINSLKEKIKLVKGKPVTENLKLRTSKKIEQFFVEKGYLNVAITVSETKDTALSKNNVSLNFHINKNKKIKINAINISGNENITDKKLKGLLKTNKEKHFYKIFSRSKFNPKNLEPELESIVSHYNTLGYRDARIIKDTVYKFNKKSINIDLSIEEGTKYYFRNISWLGNKKFTNEQLDKYLNIKKGAVYNQEKLNASLYMNPNSTDISSLYLDDGYLFFQLTPVETFASNDSIDLEIRIYEGKQATVNKITVVGNTKTNDRVILREVRTLPGQLFKRSDIIRTQRELSQMRYFNQEKLGVNPKPNATEGTVDIEYVVEEQASDQLELSGGWGGLQGIVGTLGVSFNNFSTRNFFNKEAWKPLPSGDGQTLSIRVQSTGKQYQSYNFSFIEPWLGGKKPNSLSLSGHFTRQTNGLDEGQLNFQRLKIIGGSVGLGKRLKVPDDFFISQTTLNYQFYDLTNYSAFIFRNGVANNLSITQTFSRNSIFGGIYPKSGSKFNLSVQFTPIALFRLNNTYSSEQEKYRWVEYHKWKFTSEWLTPIGNKFVISNKAGFGFLGSFNSNIGASPFERFYLGGSGLTGFTLDAREIIALRGYDDQSITPTDGYSPIGGNIISKYTMELRYPLSLNPSATIYSLIFAEAGNTWSDFEKFNPFKVNRSAGIGIRMFLPMFGLLGFDYGWPFDVLPQGYSGSNFQQKTSGGGLAGQFHFTIGMNLGEL